MNSKGSIAISQILILIIAIFAIAYAIGSETKEVSAAGVGNTGGGTPINPLTGKPFVNTGTGGTTGTTTSLDTTKPLIQTSTQAEGKVPNIPVVADQGAPQSVEFSQAYIDKLNELVKTSPVE